MSAIDVINAMSDAEAEAALTRCCGSRRWVDEMNNARPFHNRDDLFAKADAIWSKCERADFLEAFSHHPKIGDVENLRRRFAETAHWSEGEQSGMNQASDAVIARLAEANAEYEKKFGYIFIVCATGKSASEMLAILESRLGNGPEEEIRIAAGEQAKITRIRLEKLLAEQEQGATAS